ncbi:MAG: hypothetical protein ACK4M9_02570 [Anaerobacillus sp.]|uniref:hypothetical protein n=1 Tax=Anaerobacillus sp. TaxID=1872506 RepID=UPI00391A66A1
MKLLTTTITFQDTFNETILDIANLEKVSNTHYNILIATADKKIGDLLITEGKMTIQYSGELALAEYSNIHDLIVYLQKSLKGDVDDSKSFLGYLPDGESVYITKNWDKWISYIFSSMNNCKADASNVIALCRQ